MDKCIEVRPEVKKVHASIIREFAAAISLLDDGVDLTLGQPDFPTPERVKQAAERAMLENKTGYTEDEGLKALREEESRYLERNFHLSYHPENEILVTVGATQAIDCTLRTILKAGDKVLIPSPIYCGYDPILHFIDAEPVYVDTSSAGCKITPDLLEKAWSPEVKAVILTYPNNPTGACLNEEETDALADWFMKHDDVCIILDEIYAALRFDGDYCSLAQYPEFRDRLILITGVSKAYSMTGWRIGFLCAPEDLIHEIFKVHQNEISCACSISQYAALEAVKKDDETLMMRDEYRKRSTYMYESFRNLGVPAVKPEGAFYLFADISQFGMSSYDFARLLLEKYHLGCVPGSAFENSGEGYIRLSTAASMEKLREFVSRFERCVNDLRGNNYGNIADVYGSEPDQKYL